MLSAVEQLHHQWSEAAADHPPAWSIAAADDVENCWTVVSHCKAQLLRQDVQ